MVACARVLTPQEEAGQQDHLSSGVGAYSELWWHHCSPVLVMEQDPVSKNAKKEKKKRKIPPHTHTYTLSSPHLSKGDAEETHVIIFCLNIVKDLGFAHESNFAKIKHKVTWYSSTFLTFRKALCLHLSPLFFFAEEAASYTNGHNEKSNCRKVPILIELSKWCFEGKIQWRNFCDI